MGFIINAKQKTINMKDLKICMAGPSGVGKTTLCEWVQETYDIPFITASTKPLWDKHKLNSHSEILTRAILNPQWGLDFQYEVLDFRKEIEIKNKKFITDRSPIDNLAYFLIQNSPYLGEEATESYIELCTKAIENYNGLIQIPFTDDTVLENDGKRVVNKFYQMTSNSVFHLASGLIGNRLPPKGLLRVTTLPMWDLTERKLAVNEFIRNLDLEEKV